MTEADRKRLVAILGMLGSSAAGERDNAARFAEAFRRKHGLSWADLLAVTPPEPPPAPPERAQPAPQPQQQQQQQHTSCEIPDPPAPWRFTQKGGSSGKPWTPLAWIIGPLALYVAILVAAPLLPAPATQPPERPTAVAQESEAHFKARKGEILAGRHCTLAEQQEMPDLCLKHRGRQGP